MIAVALLLGCDQADLYESCQQAVEARCRAHADQPAKRLDQLLETDKRTLEEQLELHALGEYNEEASPSCSPATKAEAILTCVERRSQ